MLNKLVARKNMLLAREQKGFTVVELVIVIAVIGILAAILIPTFITLVDNANAQALQAELRDSYLTFLSADVDNIKIGQENVILVDGAVTDLADLEAGYRWNADPSVELWQKLTAAPTGTYDAAAMDLGVFGTYTVIDATALTMPAL